MLMFDVCGVWRAVWLVLGCAGVRRGRSKACWQAWRYVPGPWQFGRAIHPQPQLPFTRLHASHAHRTLQRYILSLLSQTPLTSICYGFAVQETADYKISKV